jgi:peroxiredoxin Q/BCP
MSKFKPGAAAPDFELEDQHGGSVRLSDFKGKGPVVIYFYPKDDTGGCTTEACSFRDQFERFQAVGAAILGISSDDVEAHRKFATKHKLPFTLLSDTGGRVRNQYGVSKTLGVMPGRSTIVIDKEGVVRHVFTSQFEFTKHCDEAIKALES